MKKVVTLCLALAGVLFTSCNKDDDQTPEEALAGSWQLSAEFDDGEVYELSQCDKEVTIVFSSDGTYEYIDYDPVEGNENECAVSENDYETGSWVIVSEGSLEISISSDYSVTANYSIKGNELTITVEENYGTETYTNTQVFVRK